LQAQVIFLVDHHADRLGRRDGDAAVLGNGAEDVIVLRADPAARPAGRHSGLYHVALLYPSRLELARAALRIAAWRTPIQGASDHGTHEAIYLPDPDGNGVELAADRTRDRWPSYEEEFSRGGPRPLDVDDLLGLVAHEEPAARPVDGLRVGHVHLHVGDLEAATRFYRDVVGFDVMFAMPTATFVSVGGYHHHVAFNVWRGIGVPPAPSGTVGLRHHTMLVPDAADVDAARARIEAAGVAHEPYDGGLLVRDPAGNALVIAVG
jgi:catechol 2,3-dioxygenase